MKLIYLFLVLYICFSWVVAHESFLKNQDTSSSSVNLESATLGRIEESELQRNENSKNTDTRKLEIQFDIPRLAKLRQSGETDLMVKDVNKKLDGILEFLKIIKQKSKESRTVYKDSFNVLITTDMSLEKLEKIFQTEGKDVKKIKNRIELLRKYIAYLKEKVSAGQLKLVDFQPAAPAAQNVSQVSVPEKKSLENNTKKIQDAKLVDKATNVVKMSIKYKNSSTHNGSSPNKTATRNNETSTISRELEKPLTAPIKLGALLNKDASDEGDGEIEELIAYIDNVTNYTTVNNSGNLTLKMLKSKAESQIAKVIIGKIFYLGNVIEEIRLGFYHDEEIKNLIKKEWTKILELLGKQRISNNQTLDLKLKSLAIDKGILFAEELRKLNLIDQKTQFTLIGQLQQRFMGLKNPTEEIKFRSLEPEETFHREHPLNDIFLRDIISNDERNALSAMEKQNISQGEKKEEEKKAIDHIKSFKEDISNIADVNKKITELLEEEKNYLNSINH